MTFRQIISLNKAGFYFIFHFVFARTSSTDNELQTWKLYVVLKLYKSWTYRFEMYRFIKFQSEINENIFRVNPGDP